MRFVHCHLAEIVRDHGLSPTRFIEAWGGEQSTFSRICNGRNAPNMTTALEVLDTLEKLTGKKFDVREVWKLASAPRFPVLPRGGYRHGQRRAA